MTQSDLQKLIPGLDTSESREYARMRKILYGKPDWATISYLVPRENKSKDKDGLDIVVVESKQQTEPLMIYNAQLKACRRLASLMYNEQTSIRLFSPWYTELSDVDYAGLTDDMRTAYDSQKENADKIINQSVEFLESYTETSGLWARLENKTIEMFGVGRFATVPEVSSKYGTVVKIYDAENIFPLEVVGDTVRSCVFYDTFQHGVDADGKPREYKIYNVWQEQFKTESSPVIGSNGVPKIVSRQVSDGYKVLNLVFDKDGKQVVDVAQFGLVAERREVFRLFSIFRPFTGKSLFADSLDQIKEIDTLYDAKQQDLLSSLPMASFDFGLLKGKSIPATRIRNAVWLTPQDSGSASAVRKPIEVYNTPTNVDKIGTDLDKALRRFSKEMGLGSDTYEDVSGSYRTTKEVISDNQEIYATLKKHYSVNRSEFITLFRGILHCENQQAMQEIYDTQSSFDLFIQDSAIVDDSILRAERRTEYDMNLLSRKTYLLERGLDEMAAEEEIRQIEFEKHGGGFDAYEILDKHYLPKQDDDAQQNGNITDDSALPE